MAIPTLNAQQELNNRKILEDLQHKKQLILQKGLMQVSSQSTVGLPQQQPPQTQPHDILVNSQTNALGRAALAQANSQSFGYFVASDSVFGNCILPVLPRVQSK